MVSTNTKQQIWYHAVDAIRYARYFSDLGIRMVRHQKARFCLQIVVAVFSLAYFIDPIPNAVGATAAVLIVALSLWFLAEDYSRKLAVVLQAIDRCDQIEISARALWLAINAQGLETVSAERRWQDLHSELFRVYNATLAAGVSLDRKLYDQAQEDATEIAKQELLPKSEGESGKPQGA